HLAVLRHRAARDGVAGLLQLADQLLVGERVGLVLLVDQLQQLVLDRLPGDLLAGGRVRAAAEEALEREDAARRLHPLVVHRPASSRSEEHTSELQSPCNLVCRLLLEKKKKKIETTRPLVTPIEQRSLDVSSLVELDADGVP